MPLRRRHSPTRRPLPLFFTVCALFLRHAHAHNHGGGGGNGTVSMLPLLHARPMSDTLWIHEWVPGTVGAVAGASIGLFLLALFDRFLAACRALTEMHWEDR